jgi:hypothetical protein
MPVIALWLSKLATEHRQRFLTVLLILVCIAAAVPSIYRESLLISRVFSPAEVEAGNFARDNFPPKAVILTGQYTNQPLLCLAGKPIVLGYKFWITSHGYNEDYINAIEKDVKEMYLAKPVLPELLEKYKVDYIYIGELEKTDLKANSDYFDKHYKVTFKNKDITIYDAHRPLNHF